MTRNQRTVDASFATFEGAAPDYEVAIIGAGIGGICAAVRLDEIGVSDYVILDRVSGMGGTWHTHTYPDAGCDIPTTSYQFSFARKADWERLFPKRDEIRDYLLEVAEKHDLPRRTRLNTNIAREQWDERNHLWRLEIEGGGEIRLYCHECGQVRV